MNPMNPKRKEVLDKSFCEGIIKGFISSYFESIGSEEGDISHEAMMIQAHVTMALYNKAANEGKPVTPLSYIDVAMVDVMTEKLFRHLSEYVLELDFDEI